MPGTESGDLASVVHIPCATGWSPFLVVRSPSGCCLDLPLLEQSASPSFRLGLGTTVPGKEKVGVSRDDVTVLQGCRS